MKFSKHARQHWQAVDMNFETGFCESFNEDLKTTKTKLNDLIFRLTNSSYLNKLKNCSYKLYNRYQ